MTILDAMRDRALFGSWFSGESWDAWRAFLAAAFALEMTPEQLEVYRRHTGRETLPTSPARETWTIAGRRGGKSRIAALVAVYLAAFRDYGAVLAPGEVGTLAVIAADRRQARVIMRYVRGLIEGVPMLKAMVVRQTTESIELSSRVVIEIHTASFRAVRGYTLVAAICDEVAFWRTDDAAADPDREIIGGLRPGLASIPGAPLVCISSPYARRGMLWDSYSRHFGQDGDPVLVWQAPTMAMHPGLDEQVIADAYAADDAAAAAEYGAEFRRDIESFVSREAVTACVIPDRRELPPVMSETHTAFCDPSGGSQDSMTLAIAHRDREGCAVLDAIREVRPPFSPDAVCREFAEVLRQYGLRTVEGDRYAGEWPRERFAVHGITYSPAAAPKSDIYRDLLPMLSAGRCELLDHPRLLSQLLGLERRTARGGRDSIDHAPRGHDDVVNAAAGALVKAAEQQTRAGTIPVLGF